jgi:hypothetical protein
MKGCFKKLKTKLYGSFAGIKTVNYNKNGRAGSLNLLVLRDYETFEELEIPLDQDFAQSDVKQGDKVCVEATTRRFNRQNSITAKKMYLDKEIQKVA